MIELEFANYKFPRDKACLVCEHVFAGETVTILVHDFDGWLQFLCGRASHDPGRSRTVALSEMIERLPTRACLPELKPGHFAEKSRSGAWVISKIEDA